MSVGDLYARVMGDRTTMRLKEFRHRCILTTLAVHRGHVAEAAHALDVHPDTVYEHVRKAQARA